MSFVRVVPDIVGQAAGELQSLGSTLSAANTAAAAPTTAVAAPAADDVSAAIASILGTHAREYQALSARAAAFHSQFVNLLHAGAGSYVSSELASARAAETGSSIVQSLVQSLGGSILSGLVSNVPGLQEVELALDATGPAVVALPVLEHQTAFINDLQTGNLRAAGTALESPAVEQAALYGQDTVSVQVPLSTLGVSQVVQSAVVNIPFGGLLVPLQPITLTLTVARPGGPSTFTAPIPGTEVGGLIPGVVAGGPSLLLLPLAIL